jgi:hypothetical protein
MLFPSLMGILLSTNGVSKQGVIMTSVFSSELCSLNAKNFITRGTDAFPCPTTSFFLSVCGSRSIAATRYSFL